MNKNKLQNTLAFTFAVALTLSACGGGDNDRTKAIINAENVKNQMTPVPTLGISREDIHATSTAQALLHQGIDPNITPAP